MISFIKAINQVLLTSDPDTKVSLAISIFQNYHNGQYILDKDISITPPDRPARPVKPELLPPNKMPSRSKGYKKRHILIHSIAHIELNAIDLACDMIVRFQNHNLPDQFFIDWLKVVYDEARHFKMLSGYLKNYNSFYGAYPAHNSLWDAAYDTRHDLGARLAVVPMVLEARGLDVTPGMIKAFQEQNDIELVNILTEIYNDEITHVHIGVKWFEFVTGKPIEQATLLFHNYLKKYFRGRLIPPFNIPARDKALMPRTFYQEYEYK